MRGIPSKQQVKDFVADDPNLGHMWSTTCKGAALLRSGTKGYVLEKVPVIKWLPNYSPQWIVSDLISGITIGMLLVPQSLSYATAAKLPGSVGLISSWLPMLVYMIMGSSKDTTTGPTAIMALLTGEIVTDMTKDGYAAHTIATAVAFMCGIYGLAVGLLNLGFVLDFIPLPVLSGYVSAAALTIIIQQLPAVFAEKNTASSIAEYIHDIFHRLPQTQWRDFLIGFSGIVILQTLGYLGRKWGKKYRSIWFLSICRNALVLILFTGLSYGVNHNRKKPLFKISQTTGTGIPKPRIPDTSLAGKVAARSIAVYLAAALEHLAIGKAFGRRHGYTVKQSQELLYIGVINFLGGFFQCMPVTGGFSRTAVNSESGVKSPLSGLATTACVLVSIYKLTGAFYWIPKATLSAIVICAVWPIVLPPKVFYKYWQTSFSDFIGSMVAFWVTLFVSVEYGIAAAVGYSVLYLFLRITFTRVVHVTPDNIASIYSSAFPGHMAGIPMTDAIPVETQVFQINEAILFPNAYQIKRSILKQTTGCTKRSEDPQLAKSEKDRLWNEPKPRKQVESLPTSVQDLRPELKEIIIDLRGVNYIDTTGIQALQDLKDDLQAYAGHAITFVFVSMAPRVKKTFDRVGWSISDGSVGAKSVGNGKEQQMIRDGGDVVFDFIQTALARTV